MRLAFKLFDSEGVNLVNVLKDGSAGLDEMQKRFEALGGAVSRDEIAKIERFNDAMVDLKTLLGGVLQRIVISVAPSAIKAIETLERTVTAGGAFFAGTSKASKDFDPFGFDIAGKRNRALSAPGRDRTAGIRSTSATDILLGALTGRGDPKPIGGLPAKFIQKKREEEQAKEQAKIASSPKITSIIQRALVASTRGRSANRFATGQKLEGLLGSFADAKSRAVQFSDKALSDQRKEERFFDTSLKSLREQTPQQAQGVNRLIEATSAEGIAAIRKGRRPNEKLEKLSEAQLAEIKGLRADLGIKEPFQDLL